MYRPVKALILTFNFEMKNTNMRNILSLLFFFGFITSIHDQNVTEPIKITDMLKIKTAGNISIKKDGSGAVFTVTSIVPDDKNKLDYKYETQLFSVAADGSGTPVQVTYAKEGAS